MTCNGCLPLRGPLVRTFTPVTITATGFTLQELLRVPIPPMDDPVKLVAIARPASLLTATSVVMGVSLAPAGGSTLNTLDADIRTWPFTDVNPGGGYVRLEAWIEQPGDYILGMNKTSGNGQAFANGALSTRLWWER